MNAAQISLLPHFIWDPFKLFALIPPMSFKTFPSAFKDRKAEVLALLNDPPHEDGSEGGCILAAAYRDWWRRSMLVVTDNPLTLKPSTVRSCRSLFRPPTEHKSICNQWGSKANLAI